MPKRRGRERMRVTSPPRCVSVTGPGWWVSIDTHTGRTVAGGTDRVPVAERDKVTAAVLAELRKHGWCPADPLQIRDLMFDDVPPKGG
jgi:hypothetical protein